MMFCIGYSYKEYTSESNQQHILKLFYLMKSNAKYAVRVTQASTI